MMRYLAVKNFEKFQHYKDRRPPWIKFYGAVLDDYAFVQLSDAARSHLMLIWQVAATHSNRIPYDTKYIAQAIKSRSRINLDELIASGFLIEVAQDASDVLASEPENASAALAECQQDASENGARHPARARPRPRGEAEAEAELQTETETASTPLARDEAEVARQLTSAADRAAFARVLDAVPVRASWSGEVRAILAGMAGHQGATPEQVGEALRDFVANGALANPKLGVFRRYVEIAQQPKSAGKAKATSNGARERSHMNPGEQQVANILGTGRRGDS
jgi:hypothetical protein